MPQLDFQTFFVQFFWYFILFSVNLYLLYFIITPAFCRINLMRWKVYNYFVTDVQFLNFQAELYFSYNIKSLLLAMNNAIDLVNGQLDKELDNMLLQLNKVIFEKRTEYAKYADILSVSSTGFIFVENEDLVNFTFLLGLFISIFCIFLFWVFVKEKLITMLLNIFFLPYSTKVAILVESANMLFNSFLLNIRYLNTFSSTSWENYILKYENISISQTYFSFLTLVTYLYKYNNLVTDISVAGKSIMPGMDDTGSVELNVYESKAKQLIDAFGLWIYIRDFKFCEFFFFQGNVISEIANCKTFFFDHDKHIIEVDMENKLLMQAMPEKNLETLTDYDRELLLNTTLINGYGIAADQLQFLNHLNSLPQINTSITGYKYWESIFVLFLPLQFEFLMVDLNSQYALEDEDDDTCLDLIN